MDSAQQQLAILQQNPGNWRARAELARIWREQGVQFSDHDLLGGAIGAPHNRGELQGLIDALGAPPTTPPWTGIFEEYLQWAPGCPLGLAMLAHALESSGDPSEALGLYNRAIEIDPSVAEPPLACLREPPPLGPVETVSDEPTRLVEDNRFISLMVALAAHLILILVFCFWGLTSPDMSPPAIVVSNPAETQEETKKARPKQSALPADTKTQNMQIVTTEAVSNVALSLDLPTISDSPAFFGGDDFNPSMSFGDDSGGAVSFFGSKAKTKNLVYVVDVSGSMNTRGEEGTSRMELMKHELKRSVSALPFSVRYQIIFFSNTAWFAGQPRAKAAASFSGSTDPHDLPTRTLVRATQSQKRKTIGYIDEATSGGGTNWRLPLKMAIKLKPDMIYFMTDGEIDSDNGKVPVIEDVVDYNRKTSNSRINTICLMELKAYEKLQDLASRTRGTVFLVKEDGTVLRGMQLDSEK